MFLAVQTKQSSLPRGQWTKSIQFSPSTSGTGLEHCWPYHQEGNDVFSPGSVSERGGHSELRTCALKCFIHLKTKPKHKTLAQKSIVAPSAFVALVLFL